MRIDECLQKHGIAHPVCGADVGDGWVPLIDELIQELIALGWDKDCQQIKEKFGGLRFYIGSGTDAIWDAIVRAEERSYEVCEDCGAPGTVRKGGWWKTRCDACHESRGSA